MFSDPHSLTSKSSLQGAVSLSTLKRLPGSYSISGQRSLPSQYHFIFNLIFFSFLLPLCSCIRCSLYWLICDTMTTKEDSSVNEGRWLHFHKQHSWQFNSWQTWDLTWTCLKDLKRTQQFKISSTHSVMVHSRVLLTMTLILEPMSRCSPVMATIVPPAREPFLGSMESSFGTWIQTRDIAHD